MPKSSKDKKKTRRKDHMTRQARIYRVIIFVISAIVILSWVLSLVIKY